MAALIFDASGIVKEYINERGSAWVRSLSDPAAGHDLYLTRIARIEVIAAIARRAKGPLPTGFNISSLLDQFRHDLAHRCTVLEVTLNILAEAERLAERHALRGDDAMQLAASVELHRIRRTLSLPPLVLVSADDELNRAALAEGLMVDDPNSHP